MTAMAVGVSATGRKGSLGEAYDCGEAQKNAEEVP